MADLLTALWRWIHFPSLLDGTGLLAGALFLLLGAALSSQAGRGHPHPYMQLAEVTDHVTDVRRFHVFVDRAPELGPYVTVDVRPSDGQPPLRLEDPELSGAQLRLRVLRVGQPVTARYDPQTNRIWELTSYGLTMIGPAEIARWRAEDRRDGRRRALFLVGAAALLLVAWARRFRRETAFV